MSRTKRTYNLSPETVNAVRELAEEHRVAPSQDAVVELAVAELARSVRDRAEAEIWAAAADDRAFQAEGAEVDAVLGQLSADEWPA